MKILFIDTETGGLDATKHSLLTIALAVYSHGNILAEQEYIVKYKEYVVTAKALEVNKINLVEHDSIATESSIVVQQIQMYIHRNFREDEKVIIAGHNIEFDNGFLTQLFENENEQWSKLVSHRKLDTCSLMNYLMVTGKIDIKSASLESSIKHFEIETKARHTAEDDVRATIKLFECINKIIGGDSWL